MTDLSILMHAAAPDPTRPLDLAAIHRRARVRGWRRVGSWIAGVGVLLATGIGVGDGLVVHADRGGPRGGGAQRPPTVDQTKTADAAAGVVTSRAAATQAPAGRPGPARSAPTPPPPTTAVAADAFPPAESCWVDTAGLAVNQSRRCAFSATEKGSASMYSDAPASSYDTQSARGNVYVVRDGKRTEVWNSDECGFYAHAGDGGVFAGGCVRYVVQPGDQVEVVITKTRNDAFVVTLVVGKDA